MAPDGLPHKFGITQASAPVEIVPTLQASFGGHGMGSVSWQLPRQARASVPHTRSACIWSRYWQHCPAVGALGLSCYRVGALNFGDALLKRPAPRRLSAACDHRSTGIPGDRSREWVKFSPLRFTEEGR